MIQDCLLAGDLSTLQPSLMKCVRIMLLIVNGSSALQQKIFLPVSEKSGVRASFKVIKKFDQGTNRQRGTGAKEVTVLMKWAGGKSLELKRVKFPVSHKEMTARSNMIKLVLTSRIFKRCWIRVNYGIKDCMVSEVNSRWVHCIK